MTTKNTDQIMEAKEYRQQMMDKLSLETSEADTCKPTDDDNKDLYVEKLESKVEQLKAMIDDMVDRSKSLEIGVKKEFEKEEERLTKRYQEAKSRLDEIRQSSGQAWKELQNSSFKAWKDLAFGVKEAISKFK